MNIAMLGHKRIPSREGGIEIVVEELGCRMADKNHRIIALNRRGPRCKLLKEYRNIKLVSIPTIPTKQFDALLYSFFGSIYVLFKKLDIIHYHALGPSVMSVIPKLFGRKIVVTVHGLDWKRAKWGKFSTWYLKLGERIAVKYADEIIVLSKNMKLYFQETYGRATRFIPNGINAPDYESAKLITKHYGLAGDDYLLFLARIVPEKCLHVLLLAFQKVNTDKKLVIAGAPSHSTEYFDNIKALAEKDRRVIMVGFADGQILNELYSNALLYILPSEVEGMPLGLLEAMSFGNCCLVSDIPENTEVIKNFGICFETNNCSHLAVKITELLENPERIQAYQRKSSAYIQKRYNWDTVTEQTLALYERLTYGNTLSFKAERK